MLIDQLADLIHLAPSFGIMETCVYMVLYYVYAYGQIYIYTSMLCVHNDCLFAHHPI